MQDLFLNIVFLNAAISEYSYMRFVTSSLLQERLARYTEKTTIELNHTT